MDTCACHITGGNFDSAGEASSLLKEALKRIGVEPELIRRAVIAAYEAEMNVVIHARRGRLEARIAPDRVEVEVDDEGPGIPDIPRAMTEGYSTAPPEARALGFGAGMGLPNIRRCADELSLESSVGKGTRLRFTVLLRGGQEHGESAVGLEFLRERCTDCRLCLRACPTSALRVRRGWPLVLEHLCINCTECIRGCPAGAISLRHSPGAAAGAQAGSIVGAQHAAPLPETTLVLPKALAARIAESPARAVALLRARGYRRVLWLDAWRDAVRREALRFSPTRPMILPTCPAVVALIESRYAALIPHLAPVASPIESMAAQLAGEPLEVVVSCPAEAAALVARGVSVMSPKTFLSRFGEGAGHALPPQTDSAPEFQIPRVTGIADVIRTLESIEDGHMGDVPALELFACPGGCAASPLLRSTGAGEAGTAGSEIADRPAPPPPDDSPGTIAVASPLRAPRAPRPGIRLDKEMAEAIRKLGRIDELTRALPGTDCGLCGAPTCRAMAEDVVLGRAVRRDCPYFHDDSKEESR